MRGVHRTIAPLAATVLLAAACTSGDGHSSIAAGMAGTGPAFPPSTAQVPTPVVLTTQALVCRNAIDGGPAVAGWQTVLGVVALPASPGSPALQASESGDPIAPALFAKTGLRIRTGRAFELSVPVLTGNNVGIGWSGAPSGPSRRFVVPACPDQYGTGWLAFPGGYWADRPLCLPVTVRAAGREQQVRIGIGTPCPGQEPPATP